MIDEGRAADVGCMDCSEAFDEVSNGQLIQMKMHGIHCDLVGGFRTGLPLEERE